MGLLEISVFTMKIFFALTALLTISTTSAKWTCEDCTAVVNSMASYLTSEESVGKQIDILLADVCPQVEAADECVEALPDFWAQIAQAIVDALSGDFCAASEEPERCADAIAVLIPLALPALTANPDQEVGAMICNNAIPDLCM